MSERGFWWLAATVSVMAGLIAPALISWTRAPGPGAWTPGGLELLLIGVGAAAAMLAVLVWARLGGPFSWW